ncbi:MAG: DAK2 domain-containing protein [Clostridia bacterium]|nr:DAK2 domain-containing protein [Clostridia bacterium]
METRVLDGNTFKRILQGGAREIRLNIQTINDLNVFPVPDGDTGTNMSRTIESGIARISSEEDAPLSAVAAEFSRGSLLGARGNSGVILSQFFAGVCEKLSRNETVTATEFAEAYITGVERSYAAVATPVEGTILTVFRESAEYAKKNINEDSTLEDFLTLNIEQAERTLAKTKEILPALIEADVVDSGGAGYVCIVKGMYEALSGTSIDASEPLTSDAEKIAEIDYDLFTADSELVWGYCTEALVRLQNAKIDPSDFDDKAFAKELEMLGCDSIVALKDGDILKVHAHTRTPSNILTLCQKYGEFLNVKIENMSLQHSEKVAKTESVEPKKKKPHKKYGVVTVATGDGMTALFESLGADVIINGGQTGNPSAEQFLEAFESLNADHILVLPNNSNILLTATQAAQLFDAEKVNVIPTKTLSQGYAALAVFNPAIDDLDMQLADLNDAKDAVVSGELTVAIRDTVIGGVDVHEGEYIGILDGELVTSEADAIEAMCDMISKIEDVDDREILTLFVGAGVSEDERAEMTETLEERFEDLTVEVYIGGQEIYNYLIAVE